MPSPRLFGLHSSKPRGTDPEVLDLAEESERNGPGTNSIGIRALADLWRRAVEKKRGA